MAKPVRVLPGLGTVYVPESGLHKEADRGLRARTHSRILVPSVAAEPPSPGALPNVTNALIQKTETPASLACVYRLVAQTFGCDSRRATTVATGGTNAIAIVDAYHNPTAKSDLLKFSRHFGLPDPVLTIVYCDANSCTGVTTPPPLNSGWALEIALDLDAAHAMAPNAHLILVEAHSNSYVDLMRAEDRAAQLVRKFGGGQVSNSWGGSDFSGEASFDPHFVAPNVTFFASTGDHKGGTNAPDVEYPSVSPNVVAVGGTTINRNSTGAYSSQSAWADSGGGLSAYEPRPAFQDAIVAKVGTKRGVPDISADADPASGMWVYCSVSTCGYSSAWVVVGGTSLASPLVAGITNHSGLFLGGSIKELTRIYNQLGGARLNDVTSGQCGNGPGGATVSAGLGWDLCTGVGTPKIPSAL